MNLRMGMLAGLVAAVALAAGCGSMSASGTSGGGGGGGSANTTVHSANNSKLGTSVLVNHTGMTLYTLSAEQGGRFICTTSSMIPGGSASCLTLWHPLTVAKGSKPTGEVPSRRRPIFVMQHRAAKAAPTAAGRGTARACAWLAYGVAT